MKKSIKVIHGLVILAILGFVFYWFQWRPTEIRKNCYNSAARGSLFYQSVYDECLLSNGLKK